MRKPEFSQPLVTAIQLALLEVLKSWDIEYHSVVGHSSGEIAAACAAGLLTPEEAIKIAYHRGQAALDVKAADFALGMLAVGLGPEGVTEYTHSFKQSVSIACYNSPSSVTLSGPTEHLEKVRDSLQADGHFARLLQVSMAYHSRFMMAVGDHYSMLLDRDCKAPLEGSPGVTMYSSVSGAALTRAADSRYWTDNMTNPVRFEQALTSLLSDESGTNFLIELGPSGALAGPVSQVKKALASGESSIQYAPCLKRTDNAFEAIQPLFDVAGKLHLAGGPVNLAKVNHDPLETSLPKIIVDLPSYAWDHTTKYWYENSASKEWRQRRFPLHDLLGSKVLNSPWQSPSFRKTLNVADLKWLEDHKMGHEIIMPAAGYIAMAMEAMSQTRQSTVEAGVTIDPQQPFHLRNVKFARAMVLTKDQNHVVMLTLTPGQGDMEKWYDFKVSSQTDGIWTQHCTGLIKYETRSLPVSSDANVQPLEAPVTAALWYKAMEEAGYSFGATFQKQKEIEVQPGAQTSRSHVDLTAPESEYLQSAYPMHPVCIDGCFQAAAPSLWRGHRSVVDAVLVPAIIDDLIIAVPKSKPALGVACGSSEFVGIGRVEETKNYSSKVTVFDPDTKNCLLHLSGLRYHKLDTRGDVHAHHSYTQTCWKPEVDFLDQASLTKALSLRGPEDANELEFVLNMLSHKKPSLKVMELCFSLPAANDSMWFSGVADHVRSLCCAQYCFGSDQASCMLEVQERHVMRPNTDFQLVDDVEENPLSGSGEWDLVILRVRILDAVDIAAFADSIASQIPKQLRDQGRFIKKARSALHEQGMLLMLKHDRPGKSAPEALAPAPALDLDVADSVEQRCKMVLQMFPSRTSRGAWPSLFRTRRWRYRQLVLCFHNSATLKKGAATFLWCSLANPLSTLRPS